MVHWYPIWFQVGRDGLRHRSQIISRDCSVGPQGASPSGLNDVGSKMAAGGRLIQKFTCGSNLRRISRYLEAFIAYNIIIPHAKT